MRGGFWPPALLCVALAFTLAFVRPRLRMAAIIVVAVIAAASSRISFADHWVEMIFAATWVSVVVAALVVHSPRKPEALMLVTAGNTGFWAGAVTAIAGTPQDLVRALPLVLLAYPGAWLVAHHGGIAIKVVASWLVAVAILVAALPMVPTPGYAQDHVE